MLGDRAGGEVALASHGPNRREDLDIVGDFVSLDEGPVVAIDVTVDLLDDGLDKLARVRLAKGLMKVHDVTHHFSKKGDGAAHAFLQLEVRVMISSIIVLTK